MNPTHLHLVLNHIPILGTAMAIVFLIYAWLTKQNHTQQFAQIMLALCAFAVIIVMETGEAAEETVEKLAGINKWALEEHEEAAEVASWMLIVTGFLAVVNLILPRIDRNRTRSFTPIVILIALASLFFVSKAGYYGGQIRHTELQTNTAPGTNETTTPSSSSQESEDND